MARKHARTVVCGLDDDCSAVKKKAKTGETKDAMQPLGYEEPPEQIKTAEGATELKELEADFAKFKPFTGVSRKLDGNISTNTNSVVNIDSNHLNEMTKLDFVKSWRNYDRTAVCGQGGNEEPPEQIKTEEGKTELKQVKAGFAKFKPFTGVSRKLDEKILTNTTSVAKIDSNYLNAMIKLDAVIGSRNYDGSAAAGQGNINGVGHKNGVKKFEPFTGRKYTLSGS